MCAHSILYDHHRHVRTRTTMGTESIDFSSATCSWSSTMRGGRHQHKHYALSTLSRDVHQAQLAPQRRSLTFRTPPASLQPRDSVSRQNPSDTRMSHERGLKEAEKIFKREASAE